MKFLWPYNMKIFRGGGREGRVLTFGGGGQIFGWWGEDEIMHVGRKINVCS